MYKATLSFTTNDYDVRKNQILADDFTVQSEIDEYLRIGYIVEYDGTLEITQNGLYDVEDYEQANVDVPSSTEDLSEVLNTQDTLLESQETKIGQMVQALANKKSIDLQQETADATAVAGDIADGKTAYVNGVKVEGTAEISDNNAKMLNTVNSNISSVSALIESIPDLVIENRVNIDSFFGYARNLKKMPQMTILSNITSISMLCTNCNSLEEAVLFDTSTVTNMSSVFVSCGNLKDVPVYDTTSLINAHYMFRNCNSLTNESLNNILQMCINATNYTSTKTLADLGLNSSQATTCQSLSNYNDFINAGWTTGY